MKDVADRAGVSESTVSHVINKTRYVSPEIQERVLRVMAEMNFHGNAHARRLARGHSDFLGLIISDIENPFFAGLIKAFETEAVRNGYEVLLCTTNYDQARAENSFRRMIENKTPGVAVMTSRVESKWSGVLEANAIASIFLDSGALGPLASDVRLNYKKGAFEAVNYLYNLGHREFALIAGPQERPSHAAYRKAVGDALGQLGLEPGVIEGENNVESGERAVQRLLTGRGFPTAILCSNDLTAIGAMRALVRAGIHVPAEVSVVGADDIPFSALTQPPLTTVRIPREKLGSLACEALLETIRTKRPGREYVLDTELVIRESTALPVRRTESPPRPA